MNEIVGVGTLSPTPGGFVELIGKDADGEWDRYRFGLEEACLVLPIQTSRRHPRVGQPVERDVVEEVVCRQITLRNPVDDFFYEPRLAGAVTVGTAMVGESASFRSRSSYTITLEGDANGAPHPEPSAYAAKFTGKYANRTISGGVGHNLPQEAPQSFVDAIIEVDGFAS